MLVGLRQLANLESLGAATNAVLTSTKGVAGQTAAGIRALAEKLENLNATIDDKVIQSGANLLLTFVNIRKEAFEPTLLAALDLNEAMGGGPEGLQANILKVGKALNDPTKNLGALRKAGVLFTDSQIKQIKALQKSGDLLGAQKIILKELGTEFGGRFVAQGKTAEGTIAGIGDAAEDLQKGLATALFPTVQKLLPRFRELLSSPAFTTAVATLGQKIADLFSDKNIAEGGRILESVFKAAKAAAPALQQAAEITGKVIGTAVDIFKSLPPEIQALAVAGLAINKLTGGLVTNIAGGLISSVLKQLVSGVVNVNGAVVNVVGGVPGVGTPGAPVVPGAKPSLLNTATKVLGVVTVAGLAAEFSDEISGFGRDLRKELVGENFPKLDLSDLEWPFGPKNTPTILPELGGNGLLGGTPSAVPDKTPAAIRAAAKSDTRASFQVEKAVTRNAQRIAASTAAAGRRFTEAIKDKDLSVKVTVPVSTKLFLNGRLFDAAANRFTSTIVGSRGAWREFG